MQSSNQPRRISVTWGSQAGANYIRSVPDSGSTGGAASYASGFPPLTFQPIASGGTPPAGQDMNGVLADLSAWARWQAAGGTATFDATFANAVGGYPAGAVLGSTTPGVLWQSSVDNNTGNPDGGAPNWIAIGGTGSFGNPGYLNIGGLLVQWGVAPIAYGSNVTSNTITFPTPFKSACFGVYGNADGPANAQWHPLVLMIAPASTSGTSFFADTANSSQMIASGRNARWLAVGV